MVFHESPKEKRPQWEYESRDRSQVHMCSPAEKVCWQPEFDPRKEEKSTESEYSSEFTVKNNLNEIWNGHDYRDPGHHFLSVKFTFPKCVKNRSKRSYDVLDPRV